MNKVNHKLKKKPFMHKARNAAKIQLKILESEWAIP